MYDVWPYRLRRYHVSELGRALDSRIRESPFAGEVSQTRSKQSFPGIASLILSTVARELR